MKEPMRVLEATKRDICILDVDYVATSTNELCEKQIHLSPIEMGQLKNYEIRFWIKSVNMFFIRKLNQFNVESGDNYGFSCMNLFFLQR